MTERLRTPTYDELKRYEDEARYLRSQEIVRLSRSLFSAPGRLVKRVPANSSASPVDVAADCKSTAA